ncbi:MAG: hypothetical protein JXC33_04565 [Deltaproteobacteria bacterium]|nr:hypothetical protein [Deltaproteobacteria bacterium]
MKNQFRTIHPDMTVLDVINRFRETEHIFRKYDEQAGTCICCNALFETIRALSERFNLDLTRLLNELEAAVDARTEKTPIR